MNKEQKKFKKVMKARKRRKAILTDRNQKAVAKAQRMSFIRKGIRNGTIKLKKKEEKKKGLISRLLGK